jgi:tetratricopeptide (TPR) repeat protein
MYQFIFEILLLVFSPQYYQNIEQKNIYKREFNTAFEKKDYKNAIKYFKILEQTSPIIEPELRLNASQAYYFLGEINASKKQFLQLEQSNIKGSATLKENQLGIIATLQKDSTKALMHFRKAIEIDPDAEEASYNFELLSKIYKPKRRLSPPPIMQNSPQNVQASNLKEDVLETKPEEKISREKALQLLDDLKNTELIYYKSKKNTGSKSKKDW